MVFSCQCLLGQSNDYVSVKGIVTDKANRPIFGVHCYLKNNDHFGSVADTVGYFQLYAPETTSYDTLVISTIGFETQEVPLASIADQDTIYFQLKQQSLILNEIEVNADGYDLKGIYLKALENLSKNYPNKSHQLKGLYRKIATEGNKYTKLEEAVITVDDYSYKREPHDIRISTSNFRESKEWGKVDSMYVRIMDKARTRTSAILGTSANPIPKTLRNRIRHLISNDRSKWQINYITNHPYYYGFRLMDIEIDGRDTIYQIAVTWDPTPPVRIPTGENYVKINMTDYAITEMQYASVITAYTYQYNIQFKKIDGRYYPFHIKETKTRLINQDLQDHELDIEEIWFDEIYTGKFKKIKFKDANDPAEIYSYKRQELDTTFWNSSKLLLDHPINQAVLKGLNEYEPLENQFKEMSHKNKK